MESGNKILVIPDVHLKLWMFDEADIIMRNEDIQIAIVLGDLADDWDKSADISLVNRTFLRLDKFTDEHPESLIVFGNHEMSYYWRKQESGYSNKAEMPVLSWVMDLRKKLGKRIGFIKRIQNVIFSHAGLTKEFLDEKIPEWTAMDIDRVLDTINDMGSEDLWYYTSPLWVRPDSSAFHSFSDKFFQVCGHTPMEERPMLINGILCCDVFSTKSDGTPIGSQEFVIVDTIEKTWATVKAPSLTQG